MRDINPSGEAMYINIAKQFRACQFRVPIAVAALALGLAFGTVKAQAQTFTWIAGTGDFGVATNWDTGVTPTNGDDVLFTNNTSYTVSFSSNSSSNLDSCSFAGQTGTVSLNMGSSWFYVTGTNGFNVGVASTETVYVVSGALYNTDQGFTHMTIGNNTGVGTMVVTNGTVYADYVTVGAGATSSGKLVVSGPGQFIYDNGNGNAAQGLGFASSGTITVGNGAPGCSLIVSNSGTLWADGEWTIGANAAGSNAFALITDPGTTVSNYPGTGFQVGGNGVAYATLIISNGAHVITDGGTIGGGANSNTVIVTGAGSQLIVGESGSNRPLIVGTSSHGSTNNALYVYNGGYVSDNGTLAIGNNSGAVSNLFQMGGSGAMSTGNSVTIRFQSSGTYGQMIVTNAVFSTGLLNFGGTSNSVSVLQGGSLIVSNSFALIGAGETNNLPFGGSYGTMVINGGTVSSVTGSNAAAIGIGGSGTVGNLMIITNGGKLLSENASISPSSCYVTGLVTGVGSVWSNWAGGASPGNTNVFILGTNSGGGSNDYLSVSAGAALVQQNDFRIGSSASAVSNTVAFGGPGASSTVVIGGELFVGPNGGYNNLIVSNATVNCGSLSVGSGSGTNLLQINGGTLLLDFMRIYGTNTSVFTAGSLEAGSSQIDPLANNGNAFVVGDGTHAAYYDMTTSGSGYHNFGSGFVVTNDASLRGSGTLIGGSVTVLGSFVPGFFSTPASVVSSNNVTFGPSAVLDYNFGAPPSCDTATISGNLGLGGTLNIYNSGGLGAGTYTIFTYTGQLTNTLTNTGGTLMLSGSEPAGFNYAISTNTPGSVLLVVTAGASLPPFAQWQLQFFGSTNCATCGGDASYTGDGMSNTNKFMAGFNPTNGAAYLHVISVAKTNNNQDIRVSYLGANGDSTSPLDILSRTNVLEFTTGTANGSYTNNFASTGQTNILSGGNGLGVVTNMVDSGGATNRPSRYYRVRVLLP